jgi:poly(hydroxyalkanoate) granule-associated protein
MDDTTVIEPGFGTSGVEIGEDEPPVQRERGSAERLILAGLGALASAIDSAEETFDRFVDRGAQVQEEFEERAEEVRRQNAGTRGRMREYCRGAMDAFLDGLNVPSKADVDTINVKLNILTRKIDDLQMEGVETVPAAPAAEPTSGGVTGDLAT